MKFKRLSISIAVIILAALAVVKNTSEKVIEIKEKLFIAQTNDIYINSKDYLGKTIKYEGLINIYEDETGRKFYYVIRYAPGCCGYDGSAGFVKCAGTELIRSKMNGRR